MNETATAEPIPPRGLPLTVAVVVLFIQAVGLTGLALWLTVLAVTEKETSVGAGYAEAVIALGVALLLALAARGLRAGRGGMRGLAIFVQLLFLPLGYHLAVADLWTYAVPAWIVGVGTAVLLVLPSTREAVSTE